MIVKDNLENIICKIEEIDKKLIEQNKKIDLILKILNEDIKTNCDKMNEHINFINTVYDKVKAPMYYICNKFSNIPTIGWY